MDPRYRLAPMRDLRAREARVRQGDLAGAIGDASTTAADVDACAQRVARARDAVDAARATCVRALARGDARIAEVAQLERFVARQRWALDAALGELARAEAKHHGQLAEVEAARFRLAHARAERELIDRHFARWRAERAKLAERREE